MSFSRGLESFPFRRSLVALVIGAVVLGGCSDGSEEPAEVSKTVEVPADGDGDATGSEAAAGEVAPIPFDEFDPSEYEVGDVVPEVEIVKPVVYPEMANNDEAGAEAAAQYMIDVLNYTYNTGDTASIKSISAENCSLCTNIERYVIDLYGKEFKVAGPAMRLERVTVRNQGPNGWILDTTVEYLQTPILNSDRILESFADGSGTFDDQMIITFSDGEWLFNGLGEAAF